MSTPRPAPPAEGACWRSRPPARSALERRERSRRFAHQHVFADDAAMHPRCLADPSALDGFVADA